jgi:hypothetical protein
MKPLDLNRIPGTMIVGCVRADCPFHAQSCYLFPNDKSPWRRRPCERAREGCRILRTESLKYTDSPGAKIATI